MYMNDGIKTKINLRSKSVFITGVAGFIGSNLAKRLLSTVEDVKVVGLDNMNHYYEEPSIVLPSLWIPIATYPAPEIYSTRGPPLKPPVKSQSPLRYFEV